MEKPILFWMTTKQKWVREKAYKKKGGRKKKLGCNQIENTKGEGVSLLEGAVEYVGGTH